MISLCSGTKCAAFLLLFYCSLNLSTALEEFIQWSQIEYDNLPEKGNFPFLQYNNVPQGFAPYKDKIFIAVPRRSLGIPSTLNYIKIGDNKTYINPKLYPYPNYEMNELDPLGKSNPDRIVSVYRPRVDYECERLWVVDSGVINTSGNATIIQRPSIIVIDLASDTILKRYEIPEHVTSNGLGLASITIDVIDCEHTFAYVPDLMYSKIVIYNFEENKAYSMQHNFFHMNPYEGDFNVDNLKFSWDDGIFSIALSSLDKNGQRTVYFHPMSSFSEFSLSTKILRNESLATRSYHENDVKVLGNRGKHSQSTMHDLYPNTSVLFFAQINKNAVWCWNTKKVLRPSNVFQVFHDDEKLIYPSDLKVVGDELWFMSNRMIRHIYTRLNENDFNFRIFRQSIKNMTCSGAKARLSQRKRFRN